MKFRRFTDSGIAAVRDFLAKCKAAAALDLPARDALLSDTGPSEPVTELADLDFDPKRTFGTTFAFCEYLHSLIKDRNPLAYRTDVGFWTYLAMAYLEQLVGVKNGRVRIGEEIRYLFSIRYTEAHRHLLASPYYIYEWYRANPSITHIALFHPINAPGDVFEQVSSHLDFMRNPAFMRTATRLYVDEERQCLKRGCGHNGPGRIRRFVVVVDQLSQTRDFYFEEDSDELIKILPREFDQFK